VKINFLLPGTSPVPTGGMKVILEYANRMAADGMEVTLIYPIVLRLDTVQNLSVAKRLRMYRKVFTKRLKKTYAANRWFELDKKIQHKLVPNLGVSYIPDATHTFATSWETAEWLATYEPSKGKKFYLIQGFEIWSGSEKEVSATWQLPLKKIVIARWLQDYATSLNESAVLINNGLDFKKFSIVNPIEKRKAASIIMLSHHMEGKGTKEGIAALELVKKQVPELEVFLFSAHKKPDFIPAWMNFHYNPQELNALYNKAAIFISPSWLEGWSLPPAEAMQCGCAVIVTDIGGHQDYGIDGKDLLLTPVRKPEVMAEKIIQLIQDNERRIAMAKAGHSAIQQFTWEKAYTKLKQTMGVKEKLKQTA